MKVDPRAEWKEMYHEAWRIQRDFFYDPGIPRAEPAAAEKRYEPFLEIWDRREDLNYLFADALGEMTVGHMFIGGGDSPEVKKRPDRPARRRLHDRERALPVRAHLQRRELEPGLRAPLTQPGVNVDKASICSP